MADKKSIKTICVIGAGVVGLNVAKKIIDSWPDTEVYVCDKEPTVFHHTSGRNSGIIHTGLFNEPGSLKKEYCLAGNRLSYRLFNQLGINHKKTGKLILLNDANKINGLLEHLQDFAISHEVVAKEQIQNINKRIKQNIGVLLKDAGIVDQCDYSKKMVDYLKSKGCILALGCKFSEINDGEFDIVINCAGLNAVELLPGNLKEAFRVKAYRGDYFVTPELNLDVPVYLYDAPTNKELGIHTTPVFGDNSTLIGPNCYEITDKESYAFGSSQEKFQEFMDFVFEDGYNMKMIEGFGGNRPRLFFDNKPVDDFYFMRIGNMIHCLGLESPGLTAAPVIGNVVFGMIKDMQCRKE